jgi:hypothetical protein
VPAERKQEPHQKAARKNQCIGKIFSGHRSESFIGKLTNIFSTIGNDMMLPERQEEGKKFKKIKLLPFVAFQP